MADYTLENIQKIMERFRRKSCPYCNSTPIGVCPDHGVWIVADYLERIQYALDYPEEEFK